MNLKPSRNNSDARQNLKITFRNTDYQSSPKTYAEATSQNSELKIWAKQTPTIRISNPRKNKEYLRKETKTKAIKQLSLYLIIKNEIMLPARINIFSPRPESNRLDRAKVTPKIINLSSKPLTERQINLLRRGPKFTATPKPNTAEVLTSKNLLVSYD